MVYGKDIEDLLNQAFRYALSLTHDEEDAFDLVHSSYLKVQEKGKPLITSYLIRTIRNLHIDLKRKEKLKISWIKRSNKKESYEPNVSVEPYLESLLSQLSERNREIMFLSIVQEYSAQEIADLLGTPRGSVLSILHRTKHQLREQLKETYHGKTR